MRLILDVETNYFIDADESAITNLGYSKEEVKKLNPIDLNLHFFIADKNIFINCEKFSIDKPFKITWDIKRKDGSTFESEISGQFNNSDDKQIIEFQFRKLTESEINQELSHELSISEEKQVLRLTKALIKSQETLNAVLNNLPFISWIKDDKFRYVAINNEFVNICRVKRKVAIGSTDYDFMPKDMADENRARDLEVMKSGRQIVFERKVTERNGKVWVAEFYIKPIKNKDNNIIGTAAMVMDITKHKNAQDKKDELSNL